MMRIVASPYHLTTREAPLMVALLLADQVVTLLPAAPQGGAAGARAVAGQSASYRELVRSWSWAEELWREGLLSGSCDARTAVEDVRDIAAAINDHPSIAPLRPLLHDRLFERESAYLEALAADILKGGPDPGITVPVAAGLDRFAARHEAFVMRAHPTSLAQRAETHLMGPRVTTIIPAILQADASRIMQAREALARPLATLRASLTSCMKGPTPMHAESAKVAADSYAHAFSSLLQEFSRDSTSDDVRFIVGDVALTCSSLPADAVLRSSVTAIAAVSPSRRAALATEEPALAPSIGPAVSILVVKVLGGSR